MRHLPTLLLSVVCASIGKYSFGQGETCATALPISGSGVYVADGPATGAGYVDICPPMTTSPINSDWYVYTPSFTGNVIIRSCGGGADTQVSIGTGSCGALNCVGWADDDCYLIGGSGVPFASELTVAVTAGVDHYIQWSDGWTNSGFTWELAECFGSVQGVTYRDQNSNGLHDTGELLEPVILEVNPGADLYYSDGNPYAFCSDSGSFTMTVPNPPQYHTVVPASRSYTFTAQGQVAVGTDFAFQPIPGVYDGTIDLWGQNPWIGNNSNLWITYCNEGTELLDGSVLLVLDNALSFVSAVPAPSIVLGQSITWNFTALMPGACTTINLIVNTDSTVTAGTAINSSVQLLLVQSDLHIADNLDQIAGSAVTSLDPNEKHVSTATLTPAEASAGKELEYTIFFQNTGTAPAVNIVIRDTVDSDLDLGTFEMIGSSHPYVLSIIDGTAIWSFQGILLPDSTTDEPGSHGAIHYRVTPKTTLMLGDEITNRADIYFDYNTPVLTNTVVTTVSEAQSVATTAKGDALQVFPSPTDGLAYVQWPPSTIANASVDVLDAMGRSVLSPPLATRAQDGLLQLDLSGLANGHYTVRLRSEEGTRMGKVMLRR